MISSFIQYGGRGGGVEEFVIYILSVHYICLHFLLRYQWPYTNSSLIKKNVLTWRVSWDFPALQIYDCILRAEKIMVISFINLGHFFICGWPTPPPLNCKILKKLLKCSFTMKPKCPIENNRTFTPTQIWNHS